MISALRLITQSSKKGCKTSNVASAVWHVVPSCWHQMLPPNVANILLFNFCEQKFVQHGPKRAPLTVMASYCSFSKKNGLIMPLNQNPHQTLTRFGCIGFSMHACGGFSVPQMRQFCLFTYPPRSKWASSEKEIFFDKIGIFCKSIAGSLSSIVQAYTLPYSFGERMKLIICQIRHDLSATIHEISTS